MDIKALQLVSRFSISPNSLGLCGKDSTPAKLERCVTKGECENIEEELKHFQTLWPYLKTIGTINKKDPFSYKVVESYWLGNDLCNNAKSKDLDILFKNFAEQSNVSDAYVEQLQTNAPKNFIPFHLFQVLLVNEVQNSKASGIIENINNCMIRWGKVSEINNEVTADLYSIEKISGKYKLTSQIATIKYIKDFVPNLKVGDMIAVHWNWICKVLTKDETKNLQHWTEKTLEAFSE